MPANAQAMIPVDQNLNVLGAASGTVSPTSGGNSTNANLGNGAIFTGTGEDVSQYGSITIFVYASHASAAGGLSLEASVDNVNWRVLDTYTVSATSPKLVNITRAARYFRLRYTNGGTLTTTLEIQTIYNSEMPRAASIKPGDGLTVENDFDAVVAFLEAFNGTTEDQLRTIIGALAAGTGNLAISPAPHSASAGALTSAQTAAVAGSLIAKASAGNLYGFNVTAGASAGYILVYNSATVPVDGATTPVFVLPIAANAGLAYNFDIPLRCSAGITIVFSTTGPFTKTLSATAFIQAQFV
jgi:hypothetical protein